MCVGHEWFWPPRFLPRRPGGRRIPGTIRLAIPSATAIDDYGQIDFNAATGGIMGGWFNGDFDYDGFGATIDDYGIIDLSSASRGRHFRRQTAIPFRPCRSLRCSPCRCCRPCRCDAAGVVCRNTFDTVPRA
jgi:hypothetical protein